MHLQKCLTFGVHIKNGGISVSGKALILLVAHKCAMYWPVSRATITYLPLERVLTQASLREGGGSRKRDGRSQRFAQTNFLNN